MEHCNVLDVVKAVTVAGTAEPLVSSATYARGLIVHAKKTGGDNTGNIFLGISTLDAGVREIIELTAGKTWNFPIPAGCQINLADIYIDADNSADGVVCFYFPV